MSVQRSYCQDCDQAQPYRVIEPIGEWECKVCGFAISCVECGQTMDASHSCESSMARH